MRINLIIPGAEPEHHEFGWPKIDDPVGAPKPIQLEFFDAGTKEVRTTDISGDSAILTLNGNYEDVLAQGTPIVVEYETEEDGQTVVKDLVTSVNYVEILDKDTYNIRLQDEVPSETIVALRYWVDCPGWSGELSEVYSGGGGPYKFLSFWGHPTSYTMSVQANTDSRVPAATLLSEFTPDQDGNWLKRKPLVALGDRLPDQDDRWTIGQGFYNFDVRLKRTPDQKRSDDETHKWECSPQLLADEDTRWKQGNDPNQLKYRLTNAPGSFDLEVRDISSASLAHYFHSYHTGDDGEESFGLKYLPEIVKRTLKNDDDEDVDDPVGLFFSYFDTSDRDNFKLTLEPDFSADEFSGRPIQGGKKHKIMLFPTRWAYNTRVRETSVGEVVDQGSATVTFSSSWSGPQGDLVNYYMLYHHDGFPVQGPVQGGKVDEDQCLGCCVVGTEPGCDIAHCYVTKFSGDCSNPVTSYDYEDHCQAMEELCPNGAQYTRINTLHVSGPLVTNNYKVGVWWDRFPNQLGTFAPTQEEFSDRPTGIILDPFGFDIQLYNKPTDRLGNPVTIAQIWAVINGVPADHDNSSAFPIPGIADWGYDRLLTNFPLILNGGNFIHLVSFFTDDEPFKNGLGGSFLGGWLVGGMTTHNPGEPPLFDIPFRGRTVADGSTPPVEPLATNRTPQVRSWQHATDGTAQLQYRRVPISLGAFHSPLNTKWSESGLDDIFFFDPIWRKIAGVPEVNVSQMGLIEDPAADTSWVPLVRSSEFWFDNGLPEYDTAKPYSKWDNIPVGVGISPNKAGSLVAIIVRGSTPIYVWRRTDEQFSLGSIPVPESEPFTEVETYLGHPQSFESTFASGYSHCNDVGTPAAAQPNFTLGGGTVGDDGWMGFSEKGGEECFTVAAMGFAGWADELEYEYVDQFTGPGTRQLTHVGRDVVLEQIYEPKINVNSILGLSGGTWSESSLDVVKDWRFLGEAEGQYELDVPIFVMFSREAKIIIPTEKGQFANDWPYPKCRTARNMFSGWGSGSSNPNDPDGLYPNGGYKYRCNAPEFPY